MALHGTASSDQEMIDEALSKEGITAKDMSEKHFQLSNAFVAFIKFLNPKLVDQPFSTLTLETISEDEVNVLEVVLKSTKQPKIDMTIQSISDDNTHRLLEAIASNGNITLIDIKIPRYDVNELGALKKYLDQRRQQHNQEEDDLISAFSSMLSNNSLVRGASEDIAEIRQSATQVFQRTGAYLTAFIQYVAGEDEPAPASAAASSLPEVPRPN